jgi:hypothetical protein
MRKPLIFPTFLGSTGSVSAAIQSWPQDLNKVPCDAWRHNSDGSWTEVACRGLEKQRTDAPFLRAASVLL